jgi:hypothetical protein
MSFNDLVVTYCYSLLFISVSDIASSQVDSTYKVSFRIIGCFVYLCFHVLDGHGFI